MTIWRTLLLSFLAVSLLPTTGITLLTFDQTRKALEAEIARNLLAEASAVMERIDWMQDVHNERSSEIGPPSTKSKAP